MRTSTLPAIAVLLLASCGSEPSPKDAPSAIAHGAAPVEYPAIDDNIRHDTLLIQTTFDLGDGTFVMVAGHVEPTFEGIRLYRYRAQPDSTPAILSWSTPGYDSWTMLPTFFPFPDRPGTHLLLANFGERESWGQKLLRLDEDGFTDLGYLDVAYPERITDDDSTRVKRTNIGPYGRLALHNDTAVFTFACDSVFLYDDMAGRTDIMVPAAMVRYIHHPSTGLQLWYNGERRAVKQGV